MIQTLQHKTIVSACTQKLVVIDPAVEAPEQLAAGVVSDATVLMLRPKIDSIEQITTTLSKDHYSSLHLVSHGSPGHVHLGKIDLSLETLSRYRHLLMEWGISELVIYGCEVAVAPALLNELNSLTGAAVVASTQKVGKDHWQLNWRSHAQRYELALSKTLQQSYSGSFNVAQTGGSTFSIGPNPRSVAVGDLDSDGVKDDLAITNFSDALVLTILDGGSGSRNGFSVGNPGAVAIGDLDSDGNEDDLSVTLFFNNSIGVFLDGGSGIQTGFRVGSGPNSVAIGDLDSDGNADDLAVANFNSNNVSVLLNGGLGSQTTFGVGGAGPFSVAVGDLDDDGDADDIAVANFNSNSVSVLLDGGLGSQTTFDVGANPRSIAIGDLDGDNDADDIAVTNFGSNSVSVLLDGGLGGQRTFGTGGASPSSVAIGDLDGDGNIDDLAVTNFGSNSVSVLLDGGLGSQTTFSTGSRPSSIAIGDLDSDGNKDDLAVANSNGRSVTTIELECFLTGTLITTDKGEVPVETLKIGSRIKTADGNEQLVKWVGHQTVDFLQPNLQPHPFRTYPICIKAGALGHNLPRRDLYVSPDHALLVGSLLINAGALTNGRSIVQVPMEKFVYHHVELEQHGLLLAEGTPAESYLPQKQERNTFDNFEEYAVLYPNDNSPWKLPMSFARVSSKQQLPRYITRQLAQIAASLANVQAVAEV